MSSTPVGGGDASAARKRRGVSRASIGRVAPAGLARPRRVRLPVVRASAGASRAEVPQGRTRRGARSSRNVSKSGLASPGRAFRRGHSPRDVRACEDNRVCLFQR